MRGEKIRTVCREFQSTHWLFEFRKNAKRLGPDFTCTGEGCFHCAKADIGHCLMYNHNVTVLADQVQVRRIAV